MIYTMLRWEQREDIFLSKALKLGWPKIHGDGFKAIAASFKEEGTVRHNKVKQINKQKRNKQKTEETWYVTSHVPQIEEN